MKCDHRSKFFQFKQLESRSLKKKNQGFNGIRTHDLRDTGAMLYQLSYEATHREQGQFIEFISSRAVKSCEIYMKQFIFVLRYEMKVKCDHHIFFFFQASTFQLLKLEKFTAMITLHFHLIPQYKYELFHIYFT